MLFFLGSLPQLTKLVSLDRNRGNGGALTCHARGQPGVQSSWSSESTGYSNFTFIGNPVSKQLSDFVYDFESTMNISATIYKYFFKENNSTTCHMVSENDSESSAECSMNFTCSVYYEKGYEVSETTTLTVKGLNGCLLYTSDAAEILLV